MNSNNFRFLYLREKPTRENDRGFPIACVAMRVDRNTNTVSYGVTTCHASDQKNWFSRKHGRELAVGRLMLNQNTLTLPKNKYHNFHDITWMLLVALQQDKSVPRKTQKAIKRWLDMAQEIDFNSASNDEMEDIVLFD